MEEDPDKLIDEIVINEDIYQALTTSHETVSIYFIFN